MVAVRHAGAAQSLTEAIRRLASSNALLIGTVVAAWGVIAVIAATTAFIALRGDGLGQWLRLLQPMALYYGFWALMSLAIYRVVETFGGTWPRRLGGAAVHAGLFAAAALILPWLVHGENWRDWLYGSRAAGFHALGAVVYGLNLTGSLLLRFYRLSLSREREARDARLRNSLLENQLNLARMDALKMQINPHFLFNALNSIAALIETSRNVEAYHTTELLGGLLRSALDQSSERVLALRRELEFVQRYLDVEKVRFGPRFEFCRDVGEDCLDCEVPALILQPLIENSIKHAVTPTSASVQIVLAAGFDGPDRLVLTLTDDGPGLGPAVERPGYGLANIRRRLELMYHGAASLRVANRPSGGTLVEIRVPVTPPRSAARSSG